MTGSESGLPREFRSWSIYAFLIESAAVILTFFVMVFVLNWRISLTMLYILLIVMVAAAVAIILTGRSSAHP